MKKTVPWICTLGYVVGGGGSIACLIRLLAMTASPFYVGDRPRFFWFCVIAGVACALLMLGMLIFNVVCFPSLKSKRSRRWVIAAELLLSVVLVFPSWNLWDILIRHLGVLF